MPTSGFDVTELKALADAMGRLPSEAKNAVRKSNRKWAAKLRDLIRDAAPRTGSKAREGSRHATRSGAIRASVKSRAGTDYAAVVGGNEAAPHFLVHEYGGAVFWTKAGGGGKGRARFGNKSSAEIGARLAARGVRGHVIPVKPRTASAFFFKTGEEHVDELATAAADEAMRAVATALHGL